MAQYIKTKKTNNSLEFNLWFLSVIMEWLCDKKLTKDTVTTEWRYAVHQDTEPLTQFEDSESQQLRLIYKKNFWNGPLSVMPRVERSSIGTVITVTSNNMQKCTRQSRNRSITNCSLTASYKMYLLLLLSLLLLNKPAQTHNMSSGQISTIPPHCWYTIS